ncbi:hypothetical protein MRS44_012211 [Fusarium solani]|uniref:uncharacterized protein n=1 Tax=Fusarium solani TaxID=169388 RepID=UPI0032C4ACBE|nr:hypothetical protein MRS44_012211 [Fusarium solani]
MRSPPAADANEMPAPPSSGVPKPWVFKKDSRRLSLEASSMSQTRAPAWMDVSIKHKQASKQAGRQQEAGQGRARGSSKANGLSQSQVYEAGSHPGFRNGQRRDTWRNVERIPHPDVAQRGVDLAWAEEMPSEGCPGVSFRNEGQSHDARCKLGALTPNVASWRLDFALRIGDGVDGILCPFRTSRSPGCLGGVQTS